MKRPDYEHGSYDPEGPRETLGRIQTAPPDLLDAQIDRLLKDPPDRVMHTLMFEESSRTPAPIAAAMLLDLLCDYRDVLPEIDVPTLVCAGHDEKWRTVASVEYTGKLLSDSQMEYFQEGGHCLTIEEPDRFNRVLDTFVDSP